MNTFSGDQIIVFCLCDLTCNAFRLPILFPRFFFSNIVFGWTGETVFFMFCVFLLLTRVASIETISFDKLVHSVINVCSITCYFGEVWSVPASFSLQEWLEFIYGRFKQLLQTQAQRAFQILEERKNCISWDLYDEYGLAIY